MGVHVTAIAKRLMLKRAQVQDIVDNYNSNGGELVPPERKPKTLKLDDVDHKVIKEFVTDNPTAFLDEIRVHLLETTGTSVSDSTISRALKRLGLSKKKLSVVAREQDLERQGRYLEELQSFTYDQLVFIDEVHTDNRCYNRRHGWAPLGKRATVRGYYLRGEKLSTVAAMGRDGMMTHYTIAGGFDAESFAFFLREMLIPIMNPFPGPHSVIVVDNASIHHNYRVVEIQDEFKIKVLYLPPYSPTFNPIESAFSKVKKYISRHSDALLKQGLSNNEIVYNAIESVTPEDAHAYFRNCGYIDS